MSFDLKFWKMLFHSVLLNHRMTQFKNFIEISRKAHDKASVNEMISLRLGCDKAKFMKKIILLLIDFATNL